MTDTNATPPTVTLQPIDGTPEIKPGMKTSEFTLTMLIFVLGSALASGQIVNNTAVQIAGCAMVLLKSIYYTWSRTKVKTDGTPSLELHYDTATFDPEAWAAGVKKTGQGGFVRLGLMMFVALVAIAVLACSGGQRLSAIATTMHTLNSGKAAFLVFDEKHDLDIVSASTSHADGDAKLTDYHKKRKLLNEAFAVAYRTVEDAAAIDDDHSVAGMVKAAALVAQQLAAFGVKP